MSSGTEQRSLRSAESLCPVGQSSAHWGVQNHYVQWDRAALTEECRITMSSGTEQRSLRSAESLCPVGQSSAHWGVQNHYVQWDRAALTEECRITMSSGTEQRSLRSAESLCPVGQSSAHQGVQDHCAGSASCQLLHSRVCLWRRWSDDGLGRRQCQSPDRPWYLRGCCRWLAVPGWGTTLHHLGQCLSSRCQGRGEWTVRQKPQQLALASRLPRTVTNLTHLGWVETMTTAMTASTADCVKLYSGMAEHLTGVTEAPCLIREVQLWSCIQEWQNTRQESLRHLVWSVRCRCEAVFRNGRTPDRSHWGALSDLWGADVKLYSGMVEHPTGVTEALCLIREVQMWSCDGCMWWPHTTELAHSHNHANRNVEAAMSDSDKTFDLFLYLNNWMTLLLLKFCQTQWRKLLEWKL